MKLQRQRKIIDLVEEFEIETQEELAQKAHSFELTPCGDTVLCLDCAQNGIGSESCGPRLLPQYRLDGGCYSFHIRLIPELT